MNTLAALRAGKLAGIKRLELACGLTAFPDEIFELADSLEVLNLSGNALSDLPSDLPRLHKLRVIFCSDNRFAHVPEVLGQCANLEMIGFKANQIVHLSPQALPPKLRWLILTDNRLQALPARIGSCTGLQKLMLSGNQLSALPQEMAACANLELLRIAANRFTQLPAWLPGLPRLAWLAYAGNPFSDASEREAMERHAIASVAWGALDLQHTLGEGASGIIYRAHRTTEHGVHPVAVKMFKGALTSDGLPRSEKAACIAAGAHPNLIPVQGRINAHPHGTRGLVMSLIDTSFVNLAGPPSLESCTRDIYPAATRFTLDQVLRIALGIASAAAHMHAQGVMHGDLYAHNILWNAKGECLLGDFGAASFLPTHDEKSRQGLQRIEVRAFGCLLEELLERCDAPDESQTVVDALRIMLQRCMQSENSARPLFNEIGDVLGALSA
ncbi:MAG: leucine-rich repeat-containing protein kinase family protein [Gallionella sp.]|nr:leucine-rich repeat-containing protein kinase family protein [Gallionella sp.]